MLQWSRTRLPMQETRVPPLGPEDTLEVGMAAHSSILAWEIPWTEEPDWLHPRGCKESDMTEHTHTHKGRRNVHYLTAFS